MKRLCAAVLALTLVAASCGGDNEELLTDLGLTTEEAACFTREYEARDLDIDRMLRADDDTDLSDSERDAVFDVASICAGLGTESGGDDSGDNASGDDVTGNDSGDDPDTGDSADTGDDTDTGDSGDTDDSGDDADTGNSGDSGDSGDSGSGRGYDDLNLMEQAFVDGILEEGGSLEVGICILDEFDAAGVTMLELLETADGSTPGPEILGAILRCGDELVEGGFLDIDPPETDGTAYGDNPVLDALWDACDAGDGAACDELFWTSPIGSDYEAFGDTCGERFEVGPASCETEMGAPVESIFTYGDDPVLDLLWDNCAVGDLASCDDLYWQSAIGSDYEAFGSTCGGTTDDSFGTCAADAGLSYGDDPAMDDLYDLCAAGDNAACDEMYIFSAIGSEYETFGNVCGGRSAEELFGSCESELG